MTPSTLHRVLLLTALVLLNCVAVSVSRHRGYPRNYQRALRKFTDLQDYGFPPTDSRKRASRREHYTSFKQMATLVDGINRDNTVPYMAQLNRFSVKTTEEQGRYFGLNMTTPSDVEDYELELEDGVVNIEEEADGNRTSRSVLPDSVDWRSTLQEPTSQGQCGCCWAFSTIALLESAYYRTTGIHRAFSVQELLDCTFERFSWANGCGGGSVQAGLVRVLRSRRLGAARAAPYLKQDLSCNYENIENSFSDVRIRRINYVAKTDASLLRAAAAGVVSVGIHASRSLLAYKTGIYEDHYRCTGNALPNHAVNVVGYGEEGGIKYWLLRNSWGADWGEGGYFRMSRDHYNMCNINEVVIGVQLLCQRGVQCDPPDEE